MLILHNISENKFVSCNLHTLNVKGMEEIRSCLYCLFIKIIFIFVICVFVFLILLPVTVYLLFKSRKDLPPFIFVLPLIDSTLSPSRS